jgi:hypothetical protein
MNHLRQLDPALRILVSRIGPPSTAQKISPSSPTVCEWQGCRNNAIFLFVTISVVSAQHRCQCSASLKHEKHEMRSCHERGLFPSPLWGGVRGGVDGNAQPYLEAKTPPQPSPQGGGSTPSLPHGHGDSQRRAVPFTRVTCMPSCPGQARALSARAEPGQR